MLPPLYFERERLSAPHGNRLGCDLDARRNLLPGRPELGQVLAQRPLRRYPGDVLRGAVPGGNPPLLIHLEDPVADVFEDARGAGAILSLIVEPSSFEGLAALPCHGREEATVARVERPP